MKKLAVKSLLVFSVLVGVYGLSSNSVYAANCDTAYYGAGKDCFKNKTFKITKQVRIKGESTWKDKVVDVKEGDEIEFRIRVENVGEVGVDNMKYRDILPSELERIGGDGLTEEWDGFDPGERLDFVIRAMIKDSEFTNEDFDKCVVNKVELYFEDAFEGSDTATVCYGDAEITELPETGPASTVGLALSGLGLVATGTLVKKRKLS